VYFYHDGQSLIADTKLGLFDANYHLDGKRLVVSQLNLDKDIMHLPNQLLTKETTTITRYNSVDVMASFNQTLLLFRLYRKERSVIGSR
jgi:hypothetical protein